MSDVIPFPTFTACTTGPCEDVTVESIERAVRVLREHVARSNAETLAELNAAMDADPSLRPYVIRLLYEHEMREAMRRPSIQFFRGNGSDGDERVRGMAWRARAA